MHYEGELKFLCDTLNKNHINTHFVCPETTVGSVADSAISSILNQKTADLTLGELFGEISLRTLHRHTDPFGLCYSYLVLDVIEKKKNILLMAGYSLFRVWNLAVKPAEITGIDTGLAGIWQPLWRGCLQMT